MAIPVDREHQPGDAFRTPSSSAGAYDEAATIQRIQQLSKRRLAGFVGTLFFLVWVVLRKHQLVFG